MITEEGGTVAEAQLADELTPQAIPVSTSTRNRGWLVRRALLTADLVGLTAAFFLGQWAAGDFAGRSHDFFIELTFFLLAIPFWVVAAKLAGLYARDVQRPDHSTADDFVPVLHLLTLGTWILFAFATVVDDVRFREFFLFWLFALVSVTTCRALARSICSRQPSFKENALIIGAGDVGQLVAKKILNHPEYGINLVGFVDSVPKARVDGLGQLPVVGRLEDLHDVIAEHRVQRVIIAFSMESHQRTLELIRALKDFEIHVDIVPRLFELVPPNADIHTLEGMALVGLPSFRLSPSSLLIKRAMDLSLAVAGLLVLSPLLLAIAVLIKLDSRGPVLFRQVRMGRDSEFLMLKFRTMVEDADLQKSLVASLNKHSRNGGDPRMFKIPDDPRVTRAGRFLRRYSLDELPQLWNVVRGEMSLVGARPLILEEHRHVDGWALRRLDLKPGITGLWQVSGRDSVPFGEMVRLDYLYVTSWSPWNDIRILFRTLPILSRGERALNGSVNGFADAPTRSTRTL